ncbi:MAG: hypothetical protein COA78_03790 [Blastopirellula sp.]|nr:MAG: hypothetical protein COA78_03790 [Blastopirellula sp.]
MNDDQPINSDASEELLSNPDEQVIDAELVHVVDAYEPMYASGAQIIDRLPPPRKRRVVLPVCLLLATCVTTFWMGIVQWRLPPELGASNESLSYFRAFFVPSNWDNGFTYMACILSILFAHEMGHFLMTLRHRIPASLPFFIPLPFISPIGTMGAVIGMDGLRADRKQLFDIGIAGPIAGLVVAVPIIIIGIFKLDLTQNQTGQYELDVPLIMACIMYCVEVPGYEFGMHISQAQLNPYFMAGWVGLLVTGLNMLPMSQLDGGHVTYTLFGKNAHWIARGIILVAMLFVIFGGAHIWMLMLVLIFLMGIDHPPTSDDTVEITPFRRYLGYASLSIPLLCFPPYGIILDF